MKQQSWENTARRQDFLTGRDFSSAFRIVGKEVQYENAGFWLRLFAWWWDTLIFGALQATVFVTLLFALGATVALNIQNIQSTVRSTQVLKTLLTSGNASLVLIAVGFLTVGLYCLYHVSFEVLFNGVTPGKWLIGLRVLDGHNNPLSIQQSLERNIYKFTALGITIFGLILSYGLLQARLVILVPIVLAVTVILGLICGIGGYLMAAFTVQKQTLHDQWSYSFVVIDPSCPTIKRVIFSVSAAVIIILSSIVQTHEHRSSYSAQNPTQLNSFIRSASRNFR